MSEELIGQAVSGRRNEFYLFTKAECPRGVGSEDWSSSFILACIQRSLRRIRTDRLDLVQFHNCSEAVLRKSEAIEGLQTAWERGYTRYLGHTGDSRAAKFAVESGVFDTLQTSINIADQRAARIDDPAGTGTQDGSDREASPREHRLEIHESAD